MGWLSGSVNGTNYTNEGEFKKALEADALQKYNMGGEGGIAYAAAQQQANNHALTTSGDGGGAIGGLIGAAPVGNTGGASMPGAQTEGSHGAPMGQPDAPGSDVTISGPGALRQGIGQRNPPNLMPALTGLRSIY